MLDSLKGYVEERGGGRGMKLTVTAFLQRSTASCTRRPADPVVDSEQRPPAFPMQTRTSARSPPRSLRLVDATTTSTGVVVATYERGGPVVTGSFTVEDP